MLPAVVASLLLAALTPSDPEAPAHPPGQPALTPGAHMPALVRAFEADDDALDSWLTIPVAPHRLDRLDSFDHAWQERLAELDADSLDVADRLDHLLLSGHLSHRLSKRAAFRERLAGLSDLLPFAATVIALEEARWKVEPVSGRVAAQTLADLAEAVDTVRERVERTKEDMEGEEEPTDPPLHISAVTARRVAQHVDALSRTLDTWYRHHADYDPGFSWWTDKPHAAAAEALTDYAEHLRKTIAGQKGEDDDPLVGDPIGRAALLRDIAHERLPYTPEELLAIGEEQLAWCEAAMAQAAAEMGHGNDVHAAIEQVKSGHVEPGLHDDLVVTQAREAVAFLDARGLVTIPELCRETWRLRMLTPDAQRTLPYGAYGGQEMLVAFPTDAMPHDSKLMSMRGNNEHFSRIVTPHELIPGHHLQRFMADRHNTHRRRFATPFYIEGWALYWEMTLWDLGWARGPEDRIGMLFWRAHRAARILVSLRYHLGQMTPQEMIDLLVDRVGHERDGATSEVRRYIGDAYSPLYQCGYLIGGLQLRALRAELVDAAGWSERHFHDALLAVGPMPIEFVRAALRGDELPLDAPPTWRFDSN